jgi:hypothetical protein
MVQDPHAQNNTRILRVKVVKFTPKYISSHSERLKPASLNTTTALQNTRPNEVPGWSSCHRTPLFGERQCGETRNRGRRLPSF